MQSRYNMTSLIDAWVNYYSDHGCVILLESQSTEHPESRISYLAAEPASTIKAFGNTIVIEGDGGRHQFEGNPWEALSTFFSDHKDWLFGYLGYDLKNSIEILHSENPDPVGAPDLFFMVPGTLIKINREEDSYKVLKGELPVQVNDRLITESPTVFECGMVNFSVAKADYLSCIEEAQRRIREGDFYEINLSHQLSADYSGSPYELYRQMRSIGPVPFGAFVKIEDLDICSMSPERFLKKKGSEIISQPIKGTIARGYTQSEDLQLRRNLQDSAKDQAENLMIVDLVRNDLGRIARKGSVEVSRLFDIQTFGTVHQMVSTIRATSAVENPVEIIKACYPMGSMTGAPKISAMKSIEELETYRRGIYSGAIGYLNPQGDFDLNVVIRTAILSENKLFYSVGGAITGDSVPMKEWQETLLKAQALTKLWE